MTKEKITSRIKELSGLFPVSDIMDQPMAYYSRGNRQKVALLAALIDTPKMLLIDEPIVGLDPTSIDIFGRTLTDFAKNGGTIFFATHTLTFAENYADHAHIMQNGAITKEAVIHENTSLKKLYDDTIST